MSGKSILNPTQPDMPTFTFGKLARLYRMHRSSVYEAVSKGRVSAGLDAKGNRVIDLSEAIRVWGEPPTNPTPLPDNPTLQPDTNPTPSPDSLQPLLDEIRLLREEVQDLKQTLLRIEYKPAQQSTTRSTGKVKSFADIVARFNLLDDNAQENR